MAKLKSNMHKPTRQQFAEDMFVFYFLSAEAWLENNLSNEVAEKGKKEIKELFEKILDMKYPKIK